MTWIDLLKAGIVMLFVLLFIAGLAGIVVLSLPLSDLVSDWLDRKKGR